MRKKKNKRRQNSKRKGIKNRKPKLPLIGVI